MENDGQRLLRETKTMIERFLKTNNRASKGMSSLLHEIASKNPFADRLPYYEAMLRLSEVTEMRTMLLDIGMIPTIVALVKRDPNGTTIRILKNFAKDDKTKRRLVAEFDVFGLLVSLMSVDDLEIRSLVTEFMIGFGETPEFIPVMAKLHGFIPVLVDNLTTKDNSLTRNAMGALLQLSMCEENNLAIMEAGVLIPLLSVANTHSCYLVLTAAAKLLRSFASDVRCHDSMWENDVSSTIGRFLAFEDCTPIVCGAIDTLADLSSTHVSILESPLPQLVAAIFRDTICEDVDSSCARMFAMDCYVEFIEANLSDRYLVPELLMRIDGSDDYVCVENMAMILYVLLSHDEMLRKEKSDMVYTVLYRKAFDDVTKGDHVAALLMALFASIGTGNVLIWTNETNLTKLKNCCDVRHSVKTRRVAIAELARLAEKQVVQDAFISIGVLSEAFEHVFQMEFGEIERESCCKLIRSHYGDKADQFVNDMRPWGGSLIGESKRFDHEFVSRVAGADPNYVPYTINLVEGPMTFVLCEPLVRVRFPSVLSKLSAHRDTNALLEHDFPIVGRDVWSFLTTAMHFQCVDMEYPIEGVIPLAKALGMIDSAPDAKRKKWAGPLIAVDDAWADFKEEMAATWTPTVVSTLPLDFEIRIQPSTDISHHEDMCVLIDEWLVVHGAKIDTTSFKFNKADLKARSSLFQMIFKNEHADYAVLESHFTLDVLIVIDRYMHVGYDETLREVLEYDREFALRVLLIADRYAIYGLKNQCDYVLSRDVWRLDFHGIESLMESVRGLTVPCLMATLCRIHFQTGDDEFAPEMVNDLKDCGLSAWSFTNTPRVFSLSGAHMPEDA